MSGGTYDPISTGNKEIDYLLLGIIARGGWTSECYN